MDPGNREGGTKQGLTKRRTTDGQSSRPFTQGSVNPSQRQLTFTGPIIASSSSSSSSASSTAISLLLNKPNEPRHQDSSVVLHEESNQLVLDKPIQEILLKTINELRDDITSMKLEPLQESELLRVVNDTAAKVRNTTKKTAEFSEQASPSTQTEDSNQLSSKTGGLVEVRAMIEGLNELLRKFKTYTTHSTSQYFLSYIFGAGQQNQVFQAKLKAYLNSLHIIIHAGSEQKQALDFERKQLLDQSTNSSYDVERYEQQSQLLIAKDQLILEQAQQITELQRKLTESNRENEHLRLQQGKKSEIIFADVRKNPYTTIEFPTALIPESKLYILYNGSYSKESINSWLSYFLSPEKYLLFQASMAYRSELATMMSASNVDKSNPVNGSEAKKAWVARAELHNLLAFSLNCLLFDDTVGEIIERAKGHPYTRQAYELYKGNESYNYNGEDESKKGAVAYQYCQQDEQQGKVHHLRFAQLNEMSDGLVPFSPGQDEDAATSGFPGEEFLTKKVFEVLPEQCEQQFETLHDGCSEENKQFLKRLFAGQDVESVTHFVRYRQETLSQQVAHSGGFKTVSEVYQEVYQQRFAWQRSSGLEKILSRNGFSHFIAQQSDGRVFKKLELDTRVCQDNFETTYLMWVDGFNPKPQIEKTKLEMKEEEVSSSEDKSMSSVSLGHG